MTFTGERAIDILANRPLALRRRPRPQTHPMWALPSAHSPRRQEGPEFLRPARGDPMAQRRSPVTLIAEVVPPGEQPKREPVQDVLAGKSDRTMNLMRD